MNASFINVHVVTYLGVQACVGESKAETEFLFSAMGFFSRGKRMSKSHSGVMVKVSGLT